MNKSIDQTERQAAGATVKRAVKLLAATHGLTITEVSKRSGIKYQLLYDKFNGESPIELVDLEHLAVVFERTVSEFLDVGNPDVPPDLAIRTFAYGMTSDVLSAAVAA